MSLEKFYTLRENFIILGLTGKMRAGADEVTSILSEKILSPENIHFLNKFPEAYEKISTSESLKFRRLKDFYNHNLNWKKFDVIEYKDVVLLFILKQCFADNIDDFANNICNWIIELGTYKSFQTPRFGMDTDISKGSKDFIQDKFKINLKSYLGLIIKEFKPLVKGDSLAVSIKENDDDFFFSFSFKEFSNSFFKALDSFSIFLRHMIIHDASTSLRRLGSLDISIIKNEEEENQPSQLKSIYTIAEVINSIIKVHRHKNEGKAHIIIDRLKNSYELNYFREKYAGFYTVAISRNDQARTKAIEKKIKEIPSETSHDNNYKYILDLDQTEYKTNDFKKGYFESYDIENCVQKADYHIRFDERLSNISFYDDFKKENGYLTYKNEKLDKTNYYYIYTPLLIQVLKLTALIKQPGLITPSYVERMMQIAFNARLNSGCISRQVGAVVTDAGFSVKGVGWNEVPHGHTPCSSRDIRDFKIANPDSDNKGYTKFELGDTKHRYNDNKSFKEKLLEDIEKIENSLDENLKGRPCSMCFKSHHNAYEAKDNQVHTRSLHAEENAMLQISKHGGQPLNGGNLFTTASTCELCAKKAYQLGIKNIFYIDIYPGISNEQILKNGYRVPKIYAYQGAIGRGFNRLYEPLMSQKDESYIRVNFKPTVSQKEQKIQLINIIGSQIKDNSILKNYIESLENDDKILEKLVKLMEKGLEFKN